MKTAVSIKDTIFQNAENYSKRVKISRSQLYSDALEEYLANRNDDDLIARINAVCEEVDTSIDPHWKKVQSKIIDREKW
jgi:metal-responsive CopG/Arc/MetJ family transcriptional regulator